MRRGVLRHAFLHPLQLFRRRFALILCLPLCGGHAVDQRARFVFRELPVGLHHPIGQAIAAKASEAHEVDILRIMPVLQMRDEAAKCGGGGGV